MHSFYSNTKAFDRYGIITRSAAVDYIIIITIFIQFCNVFVSLLENSLLYQVLIKH